METPDADLKVARDFLVGVNEILQFKGKRAYGLYNHSPSFDWDVKFFAEAEDLTKYILSEIDAFTDKIDNSIFYKVKKIITSYGSYLKGDCYFDNAMIEKIAYNCIDYLKGPNEWYDNIDKLVEENKYTAFVDELYKVRGKGYRPAENITEVIVEQRLVNFGKMLSSFGYNMHLITLPEFHITAFNMYKLSKKFSKEGINAFVKETQRPERILSENDNKYTYYQHQTATGTGVEAAFSEAVGSSNVNILSESTESDDIKKRGG